MNGEVGGGVERVFGRCVFVFFFQAEDGIRDYDVTGVQTCALPIWCRSAGSSRPWLAVLLNMTNSLHVQDRVQIKRISAQQSFNQVSYCTVHQWPLWCGCTAAELGIF